MSRTFAWFLMVLSTGVWQSLISAEPISLHPDNPHYFKFRNQPTILVTSGEHYGAVLNAEFDFVKYLDELSSQGLNHTRIFSGAYVEPEGAFNIQGNTLAPKPGMFVCPWARSDQPGYANGGNKFDLNQWDAAYFTRLRKFMTEAGRRGIVVEVNLFCPMYEEMQWKLSPFHVVNNVNGVGRCDKHQVYTLDKEPALLGVQEKMVRKLVDELQDFDNVFFEICNEPYFGGVTMEWQRHIVDVIVASEQALPTRHLISMNIANGSQKIENSHPEVSIFNFHYAHPPDAVAQNYGLNKVIGENETGFEGTADAHYRHEAWQFLLAGGGLFNNLDYSFTVGHEEGSFAYPETQPGGGNRGYRKQLKILKEFLNSFDFLELSPDPMVLGVLPQGVRAQVLTDHRRQFAIYLQGGRKLEFTLSAPMGQYRVDWIDVLTGETIKSETLKGDSGRLKVTSPEFSDDIALRIIGS